MGRGRGLGDRATFEESKSVGLSLPVHYSAMVEQALWRGQRTSNLVLSETEL